ncbi:MAG: hypothetical protein IIY88_02360 [Eubacterium sp.]|nr:hypothetical protein [Eubacterium sp.]
MDKIIDKLTDHFAGSRTKARVAFFLFAFGILVFVLNNTILFFVDEQAYFWPRLCMKGITDICWVAGAVLGTKYYPTKRNMILLPTLLFYMLGDIAVFFSIPVGGVLYGVGHIFMMIAILETTYLRRWQRHVFIIFTMIPVVAMIIYGDAILIKIIGIIYGMVVTAVMASSLSNRFFWLAGFVFYVSDITGFLRISLLNNKVTYVITTFIYFAAFFMLCISVYSINRKEVVTWNDLFSLLSSAEKRNVRIWVCGTWALGLIKGNNKFSYEALDVLYNTAGEDDFRNWLKAGRYEKEFGKEGAVIRYYSEKYGTLRTYPCTFMSDGTAVMMSEKGHRLMLDEGFFKDVKVLGRSIPCIAPGGQELTSEVLKD